MPTGAYQFLSDKDGNISKNSQQGHQFVQSGFNQLITPVPIRFPIEVNTPVQLENIQTSYVTIINPIENDPIYVGGLADQAPYINRNFVGDNRGTIVYPGQSMDFEVINCNLLQIVGTPMQLVHYHAYSTANTSQTTVTTGPLAPITVTSTTPTSGATGIANNADITVTLSDTVDPTSLDSTSFSISPAATVTLSATGSTITMHPTSNLLQNTTYTITVGKTLESTNDMGLLVPYVFTFTTIPALTVSSTSPADGATNIERNTAPSVIFNRVLDITTVTDSTITISPSAAGHAFSDSTNNAHAGFQESVVLTGLTAYTVTLTTGIKDLYGNSLASPFTFTFTTKAAAPPGDFTAPTITSTTPADSATSIAIAVTPVIVFSESIAGATVTTTNFVLLDNLSAPVARTVALGADLKTVTITPNSSLSFNTQYQIQVKTGVTDLAANALAAQQNTFFTTVAQTIPTVTSTVPAASTTGVSITTTVKVNFSTAMDPTTLISANVQLLNPSPSQISCSYVVAADNLSVTLTPNSALANNTVYTVKVTTSVKAAGVNGGNLASQFTDTFTTIALVAPTVTATTPVNGHTGDIVNTSPTVTFSKAMDVATITSANLLIQDPSNANVPSVTVTLSADNLTATLDPAGTLLNSTTYTIKVTTSVKDTQGLALATTFTSTFTTVAASYTQIYNVSDTGSAVSQYTGNALKYGMLINSSSSTMHNKIPRKIIAQLAKNGSPTGTITCEIWDTTTGAGTKKATIGSSITAASLTTTKKTYTFEDSTNNVALATNYALVIAFASTSSNSSNYVKQYRDDGASYDGTNTETAYISSSSWNSQNNFDAAYTVYT